MEQRKDYLAHYGVLGQKWGIRRYQDYPKGEKNKGKFIGTVSKAASSGANRVKTAAGVAAKNAVARAKDRVETRREDRKAAAERGMSSAAYRKVVKQEDLLRNKALSSHNPKTVVKGMQYLSDAELEQKLQRLQKEAKIRQIAKQMPDSRRDQMVERVSDLAMKEIVVPTIQKNVQPVLGEAVSKKLAANIAESSGKDKKQASDNAERIRTAIDEYSRDNIAKYNVRNLR